MERSKSANGFTGMKCRIRHNLKRLEKKCPHSWVAKTPTLQFWGAQVFSTQFT